MTRACFTLLELILVLAVLGMLASVVAARLSGLRGTQGVEVAARLAVEQALRARRLAVAEALPVRLRLDFAAPALEVAVLRDGAMQAPGDGHEARTALKSGAEALQMSFVAADGVDRPAGADLVFAPDGRCDPSGILHIAGAGRTATVRIPAGPGPITVTHAP